MQRELTTPSPLLDQHGNLAGRRQYHDLPEIPGKRARGRLEFAAELIDRRIAQDRHKNLYVSDSFAGTITKAQVVAGDDGIFQAMQTSAARTAAEIAGFFDAP